MTARAHDIEAINCDQLVTPTDRLLLRGRVARRWPDVPSLVPEAPAPGAPVAPPTRPLARGSQPYIARPHASQRHSPYTAPGVAPHRAAHETRHPRPARAAQPFAAA